ncbi:hypothetical protein [Levilactobacillus namurensis]|uniref:hypothetical protein n=1 Tax=Levilactobacillus namurensis TaxID=380393 RepID=UPI00046701F9|nr:hypothetical protein [Levilactobacillus namurensis]
MKILAMKSNDDYCNLVVENNDMFYTVQDDSEVYRIERPGSAYKFASYVEYDGGLSKERLMKIECLVDEIGDDLPEWYRDAKRE